MRALRFPARLTLLGNAFYAFYAFYPVLVHRLAASLHASFPHSVALMQLRFASFVVINLRGTDTRKSAPMLDASEKRPHKGGRSQEAVR